MSADEIGTVIAALGGTDRAGASDSLTAMLKGLLPSGNDTAAAELATEMSELKTVSQRQSDAVTDNTDAVSQNTSVKAVGSEPALVTAGKSAGSILSSGFGLAPLFTGLFHLFDGGGSEPEEVVYSKTTRPPSIRLESLCSQTGFLLEGETQAREAYAGDVYDAYAGDPSAAGRQTAGPIEGRFDAGVMPEPAELRRSAGRTRAPTQITVQVQALDSRSFLDHRDEIARAVRSAMLNSNSLNDVVSEL